MFVHEILDQQIARLRDVLSQLETARKHLEPMTLDDAEAIWDDLDIETLSNAQNFGDFAQIVKRIAAHHNIGGKKPL